MRLVIVSAFNRGRMVSCRAAKPRPHLAWLGHQLCDLIADIITGLQRSRGGGGGPKLLDASQGLWYKGRTINIG